MNYDIHVFESDDNFFLYPTRSLSISKIRTECVCLYRLENKTVNHLEKIECVRPTEIDGIVISWMAKKGINKVRGGSFSDPIISNSEKECISKQIKFMNYELENIDIGRMKIQNQILKHMPKASIADLEWLKYMIATSTSGAWKFMDKLDEYSYVIEKLVAIYNQYVVCVENTNKQNYIYFRSPRLYFDARIIPGERLRYTETAKHREIDAEIFKTYELFIYTLLNRTEEFRFDLSHYIPENENTSIEVDGSEDVNTSPDDCFTKVDCNPDITVEL